jgi:hypothetical protein
MTRDEALEKIKECPIDADRLFADKEYIIKKFGLTAESFDALMSLPVRQHTEYASMVNVYRKLKPVYRRIKPIFKVGTETQPGVLR